MAKGRWGGKRGAGEKALNREEKKKKKTEECKKVLSRQHSRVTKDPDRV